MLKELLKAFQWLFDRLLKVMASVGTGYLVYSFLSKIAYEKRGYHAYGGECIMAVIATMTMLVYLADRRKE